LIFGHVETKQLFVPKQIASEGQSEFGFSDTSRTKEEEAAARAGGCDEAEFATMKDRDEARDYLILSADLLAKMGFEVAEMFQTVLRKLQWITQAMLPLLADTRRSEAGAACVCRSGRTSAV
jgi:hypothetical protein